MSILHHYEDMAPQR